MKKIISIITICLLSVMCYSQACFSNFGRVRMIEESRYSKSVIAEKNMFIHVNIINDTMSVQFNEFMLKYPVTSIDTTNDAIVYHSAPNKYREIARLRVWKGEDSYCRIRVRKDAWHYIDGVFLN